MPEEDNPFMVKPKPANQGQERMESFGSDEVVSFMVDQKDLAKIKPQPTTAVGGPHWESSGTPIWDKKNIKDIHNPEYEVVDHDES
ncbi:MAG: hypothetical protein ACMUIE_03005 [Thermoplasmatota archaeon]